MTLMSVEDVIYPSDLREYDTLEYEGNIYLCEKGARRAGTLAVVVIDGDMRVVDGSEVKKGFAFNLRFLASGETVQAIKSDLRTKLLDIVNEIKSLPAINLSIIYDKKYYAKASMENISVSFLIENGYVLGEMALDGQKTVCKFSYSAKHDTIEKKACGIAIYQLFGEEMVYIKNRINALL